MTEMSEINEDTAKVYILRSMERGNPKFHGSFDSLDLLEKKFKSAMYGDPINQYESEVIDLMYTHWETLISRRVLPLGSRVFWLDIYPVDNQLDQSSKEYLYQYKCL